jgi:hypothetical protein
VVEHRHQRREEQDRGQHAECEDEACGTVIAGERTEHEFCAPFAEGE